MFAYLGPEPAQPLSRREPFTWNGTCLEVGIVDLLCNRLQWMENSMDPDYLKGLYGYWGVYQEKTKAERSVRPIEIFPTDPKSHKKIEFDPFEYGIIKRGVAGGTTEDDSDWKTGHSVDCPFPQILFVGSIVTAMRGPEPFGSRPLISYTRVRDATRSLHRYDSDRGRWRDEALVFPILGQAHARDSVNLVLPNG